MQAPLLCGRCGAPLALPEDPAARDVPCTFCGTRTPLPGPSTRGVPGPAGTAGVPAAGPALAIALAASGAVLALAVGAFLLLRLGPAPAAEIPGASKPAALPTSTPGAAAVDAGPAMLGTVVRTIGGKGTAAGLWPEARTVAVDPDGNLYVGEYSSGRIHQFDPTGKFLQVIQVPPHDGRSYLFGLAADWAGSLVVSRAHEVLHLSRKDFSVTGTVREILRPDRKRALPSEMCAHGIAVDTSNQVYVMSNCTPEGMSSDIDNPYSVVKLDAKGRALAHWKDIRGEGGIAADGAGSVFLASDSVSVLDGAGKLVTRWGQAGHDPGDFPSRVSGVAVDGKGHVLVLTWSAVQAFDARGKLKGLVAAKGGRQMAVGPNGHLYVLDDAVTEYALDPMP